MATPARMSGSATRTAVLLIPKCLPPVLAPLPTTTNITATATSTASPTASSSAAAAAAASSSIGPGLMMGMQPPKFLDSDWIEGLLAYVRLLFAQPQGGKLSVLGCSGNKMNKIHTITSWDPGQQTLESIMKGLSQWKYPEEEFITLDLQLAIQEAVQMLLLPSGTYMEDEKSQVRSTSLGNLEESSSLPSKIVSEPWKAVSQMGTTRLVVMMAHNWGAGGSADICHRMVLTALLKIDRRSSDGDCCDALFLDLSSTDSNSNTCVCMQHSDAGILLSTSYYKLPPACTSDLLLDLAYVHFELCAIAVKGLSTAVLKHTAENSGGNVSTLIKREDDKGSLELNISSETDLRLVLSQTSPTPLAGGCCFTPTGGELRKSRTKFFVRVKRPISKSQLLALPCTSVTRALLEVPLSRDAAQSWETIKVAEVDAEGHVVLALSSERDSMTVTHVLVWQLERFWLHALKVREGTDATKGEAHFKLEELADDKGAIRCQGSPLFPPNGLVASMPGNISDDKPLLPKKRGCEEVESGNQCCAPPVVREKKSSKQVDRPTRCYPLSSETVIGGPDRHSASLAALLAPIRGVFMSEDPATELVNTATSYVARLLELTEKNDGSLFPHVSDVPVARRELYKKMWWELKRLAKRIRKDKTQGQEDLAQAIRAARADFKTSEQQLPQPLPALTEKATEHVHINKRRRCEEVPRDIHGRPIFPIKLGPSLQVYDLGSVICNRPAFHNEKYIWPAGYKSRRAYASMLNSENRIFYWCEIVDDGQAPEFRLTPEDDENNPVIGISATAVWTVVVKRVGALRLEEGGKKTFANVSGPEYFGFANPTIARLIQQLPNSERCTKYKRQDYFPNVPMRATEMDAWQGVMASEYASSPQTKESATEGKESTQSRSPHEQGGDHEMADIGDRGDQGGALVAQEEAEAGVQIRGIGIDDSELRGMSWDSEEFQRALARRGKLGLAEFSKQFLASNSGSLFSYYWSAKLKRATEVIELDGRK